MAIIEHIRKFTATGHTDYHALLLIPQDERITALAAQDRQFVHLMFCKQIFYNLAFFTLKNPPTQEQIFLLADACINEAAEDWLAVEDFYIFLYELATGKRGQIYERLDIPVFMEKFETYRQERHEAYLRLKEEKYAQHKAMGPGREHEGGMRSILDILKPKQ
jgi:hypothetical protein